jgi:hypothetical protein
MRGFTVLSICVSIAAGAFWGIAVYGIISRAGNSYPMRVDVGAAEMTGGVAAFFWLVRWVVVRNRGDQGDQDRTLLIRTLAGVVPARPPAKTIPMQRVPRAL